MTILTKSLFVRSVLINNNAGEVRALVIRDWLSGKPRDTIAHDNVVSFGAVSNIVNEWRHALDVSDGDALRELGIMFRKLGITAPQCAIGFRLANILKDLGVDEENFGNFVSQVYNQCTKPMSQT